MTYLLLTYISVLFILHAAVFHFLIPILTFLFVFFTSLFLPLLVF